MASISSPLLQSSRSSMNLFQKISQSLESLSKMAKIDEMIFHSWAEIFPVLSTFEREITSINNQFREWGDDSPLANKIKASWDFFFKITNSDPANDRRDEFLVRNLELNLYLSSYPSVASQNLSGPQDPSYFDEEKAESTPKGNGAIFKIGSFDSLRFPFNLSAQFIDQNWSSILDSLSFRNTEIDSFDRQLRQYPVESELLCKIRAVWDLAKEARAEGPSIDRRTYFLARMAELEQLIQMHHRKELEGEITRVLSDSDRVL